jgi:uncharacterized membrane protein
MDYLPLNTALMSHPANWVIVTLMVLLAGIAVGLIFHPKHDPNAEEGKK